MATYNANAGVTQGTMSDQDLWAGMQQHLGDPAALAQYMQQNGLSRQRTSQVLAANGHDPSEIQQYMDSHKGFDPWGGNYGPNWTGKDMSARAAGAGIIADPNAYAPQAAPQTAQPTDRSNQGAPVNPYLPQTQAQTPAAVNPTAQTTMGSPTQTQTPASGSNLGLGGYQGQGSGGSGYAQNPYTNMMAGMMGQQVGDTLSRYALPAINQNAVQAGGVGGSRQGVAQGLAIGEASKGLAQGLGNLYSNNYMNDQNLGLQGDRLNLDVYNANQNWQNQGQQNQVNYLDHLMNWNQQGLINANTQQNTPMNYWQQFSTGANQAGGQGQSQNMPGNPWLGALGGAQLGAKLWGG